MTDQRNESSAATTTPRKDEPMTVYEVIDGYFRRFGLFATRDKAEEWAEENPLHYFVGIEKMLATPAENRYRIKEVAVA
jgi:hypothetical protein